MKRTIFVKQSKSLIVNYVRKISQEFYRVSNFSVSIKYLSDLIKLNRTIRKNNQLVWKLNFKYNLFKNYNFNYFSNSFFFNIQLILNLLFILYVNI